jgi:hypothetical protein
MLWFVGVVYVLGSVTWVVFENQGWKGWVVVVLTPLIVLLRIQLGRDASPRKRPQQELDLSRWRPDPKAERPGQDLKRQDTGSSDRENPTIASGEAPTPNAERAKKGYTQ